MLFFSEIYTLHERRSVTWSKSRYEDLWQGADTDIQLCDIGKCLLYRKLPKGLRLVDAIASGLDDILEMWGYFTLLLTRGF